MSDVIEALDKNIKTLEMLEKEYAKRATPRMKYASIRSALNNGIIALKKTRDRYSEELAKNPQECEWFKYDYRTIAPKNHDVENPYWRIPENMDKLKYCPYCGRKIKVGK